VSLLYLALDQVLLRSGAEVCLSHSSSSSTWGNSLDTKVYHSSADLDCFVVAWDKWSALSDEHKSTELGKIILKVELKRGSLIDEILVFFKLDDRMAP
jgi:hypothetical protein